MFSNKEYVYEVYKEKSFSKAAENLYITQPSLSLTIKRVEGKIGSKLFDRSTTPIQLTESGQEYIKCLEQIIDIEHQYQNYLCELNDLKTGTFTIGATHYFTSYILPHFIAMFMDKYPMVKVNVIEGSQIFLEKRLLDGNLDLVVDNITTNGQSLHKIPFYKENILLAIPKKLLQSKDISPYLLSTEDIIHGKHLQAETPGVPFSSLYQMPFVMLKSGHITRRSVDNVFSERNIRPNIVLEVDQMTTAYSTACHGLGATFVSDSIVKESLPDPRVAFCTLGSEVISRDVFFYHKVNKHITKAMRAFLDIACA